MSEQAKELMQVVSAILLRCWIIGFAFLFIAFGASQLAHDLVVSIHGSMFDLTPHEFEVIFYCALGMIKLGVLICFFIPWLAIKMVMPKQS